METEKAGIYNVRTAVGLLVRNGKLPDNIQPTLGILARKVLGVAAERGVHWEAVFEEVVTGRALRTTDAMGGTDHPDPTRHSSPIAVERE
ncbi:MAG: hypothetical protein AAB973_01025 [Patescibacteria group bacterium]